MVDLAACRHADDAADEFGIADPHRLIGLRAGRDSFDTGGAADRGSDRFRVAACHGPIGEMCSDVGAVVGRLHVAKDHAARGVSDHDPLSKRVERGRESIRRRDGRGLASRGPVDRAAESIDARPDRARLLADLAPESGGKRVEARRGAAFSREEEESGAKRHHDADDRYHPHCVQASCVDSSATSTSSSSAFPDGWPPVTM